LILFGCAKEDPNERANALFIDATKLLKGAASAQTDEAAVSMYREGLTKLDTIVTKYPTSNLAVQLASGQQIGDFSRARTQRQFEQQSGAMHPTLQNGDKVVALKYDDNSAPKRGDIVVFVFFPKEGTVVNIKRIIGLPGERVQMIDGNLNINGAPVKRERAADFFWTEEGKRYGPETSSRETLPNGISYGTIDPIGVAADTPVCSIPPDNYFVLSDNRVYSIVSFTGCRLVIPSRNIIGRAIRP
jgi:signal peptidase I